MNDAAVISVVSRARLWLSTGLGMLTVKLLPVVSDYHRVIVILHVSQGSVTKHSRCFEFVVQSQGVRT